MMKNRFGKSAKHQKLTEDPSQTVEPLLEGVTFYVKYLGMFIVDKPNDEQTTADAVKKIVSQAKSQNRVRKVSLTITPKGIEQVDLNTKEDLETISIYRISYCTADKNHDKVFGYIARNLQNETLECHAFLCNKRKHAEELCLTVAQAFNVAFETELWDEQDKDSGEEIKEEIKDESSEKDRESPEDFTAYESVVSSSAPSASSSHMIERHHNNNVRTAKLLDVPGQPRITTTNYMPGVSDATQLLDKWNITDDSNLDESFSKLAETRSNPKLHDVNKSDSNQDIMKNYSQGNPTQQSKSVEDLLCL
ncbi:low density lipoprotein receptor adapter protein 1-like isoform X2 [Ptychodera flava]|uniref:low density lipoprotein receptor adapter protein 1-like isoform X2 n=1 Tax=Ptychodera flava TaxID=63121 RepID=UPI003969D330